MPRSLSAPKSRAALYTAAVVTGQLLLVLLGLWVVLRLLGIAWSVIWPLVIALLLTTPTEPPTRWLRNRGWRPTLAAITVTLLSLLVVAGILVLIVVPVANQS